MVFNCNYIDLKNKKTGVLHLNSGVLKTLLRPPSCVYVCYSLSPYGFENNVLTVRVREMVIYCASRRAHCGWDHANKNSGVY
jgi:hypothetical protein